MQAGLIEEVRRLKDRGYTKDMVSMQGLGYKEILDYLDGNTTLEEAVYILNGTPAILQNASLPGFVESMR